MRHAYLIMAHANLEQLKRLVCFLDYKTNDIYVHIDRKCKEMFDVCLKNARLTILENPMSISWGVLSNSIRVDPSQAGVS